MRYPTARLLVAFLALALVAAACGDGDGGTGDGEGQGALAENYDLSDASLTVGSKEFTEQLVLGQIAIQALEAAGADVSDQTGLGGTEPARQALTSGEIDLYWEYTGTGWIQFLGETELLEGSEEYYQQVSERDREENGIVWLEPAPLNNTYQIATTQKVADETGAEALSDYAELVGESPEDATLCSGTEFTTRDDGLPGLEEHYDFDLPDSQLSTIQLGAVYQAVANQDPCEFGSVFATDGRIPALDLVIVEDDENFFPAYNAAVTMTEETFEEHSQLEGLFGEISPKLDNETMQELNRRVDQEGEFPDEVARDFLQDNDLIS